MRARRSRLWWIPVGLLASYTVAFFLPVVSPFARYPIHYLKCGGPPIMATGFAAANVYRAPGDDGYGVNMFVTDYFCTEEQAQAAGFDRAL